MPKSRPRLRDRVRVYWPKHARTYCGVVVNIETVLGARNVASYRFQVAYDDGDRRWHDEASSATGGAAG